MPARLDPALIPPAPNLVFEQSLWINQIDLVAGLDEAGRGAWAGPVSAAAVIFSPGRPAATELAAIRDSKQISAERRYSLEPLIKELVLDWGVGFASSREIDDFGILPATRLAMTRALEQLKSPPAHLLIDALFLPEIPFPQTSLIKGDQRSLSIAAASILAKTARDRWMVEYSVREARYGFGQNKGYGTKVHQAALSRCGPCTEHRFYYAPIRNLVLTKTGMD